jgi:hypothetical protein
VVEFPEGADVKLLKGFVPKILCFLVLIGFSGLSCFFVPVVEEDKYEEEKIVLEAGVSTKEEVVQQLGEPDVIWETRGKEEYVFVYKYKRRVGYCLIWSPPCCFDPAPYDVDKALLIFFNEADRVERIDAGARKAFESYGDFLRRLQGQIKEDDNDSEG